MEKLVFLTDCVSSTESRITEMVDLETEISAHSFIYKVAKERGIDDDVLERLGYTMWGKNCRRSPKRLFADDIGTSCHRSWYLGYPAYYVRWSAIEHVYVNVNQLKDIQAIANQEAERQRRIDAMEDAWDTLCSAGRLLGVPLVKRARRFAEKHREELMEWRIPLQLFIYSKVIYSKEGTPLNRFVTRWDEELLT